MRPDSSRPLPTRPPRAGFSLIEMMVTLVLLAIVVAVIATVMIGSQRSKSVTEARLEAQQNARTISDMIANDLRSAGYQIDETTSPPQLAFAYVDSLELVINANLGPFPDTLVVAGQASPDEPLAYNPSGTPLVPVLDGTGYEPPMRYTTGAETIRYTLDLNDDGVIDANDQSDALALDAQRTANPNDFVLARAVYGDSTADTPGNNGGAKEKLGLVRGPGPNVPPLFNVYLGSVDTPWDWSDGAIPANRLDEISRIELRVTTESRRPGPDGEYTRTTLTNEVNSIRNVPNAASTLYSVEGWVFDDLNESGERETGEPGIPNAVVRMGNVAIGTSNALGYYRVTGPPAVYGVKQFPPVGYGAFSADSITVDFLALPGDFMHNFADTVRAGGFLLDSCFVDVDGNGVFGPGDEGVSGVTVDVGGQSNRSSGSGAMATFLPPGSHVATYTAPESMVVVSTNPATVSITDGVNTVHYVELERGDFGTVEGYVYRDNDRDGFKDTGEPGMSGVWVGVTKLSGTVTLAFDTTDSTGFYSIQAPVNMPAATTPYEITLIPPGGYYPTTSIQITPIWLSVGQTITGQHFGVSNFTQITLNADRVLSLASGNLLEKDWSGADGQWATKASFDIDLVLGSEYVSNPNLAVWFNGWNPPSATTCFTPAPTYTRNAQSSALSVAVGPLDVTAPSQREDVVTGLARKPSGNIAVWMNQNSSANLGQLAPPPSNLPLLYQTQNTGDANIVVLQDFGGTTTNDFIVGTTGAANTGTLETWINSGSGTFTRDEIYPPQGNLPSGALGEVKAISFVDVTGDGVRDLIVGTKIAPGLGRVHVLGLNSRTPSNRYRHVRTFDVIGEVTSMMAMYVDFDAIPDLVVGTRISSVAGDIQYWKGAGGGLFALVQNHPSNGPVLAMGKGDFGANAREDIVYGFRTNESVYSGGTRILFLDAGVLPVGEVDPAAGGHDYMSPAITVNNFNYRLNPTSPGAMLLDMAVATKTSATTGALLVFIR